MFGDCPDCLLYTDKKSFIIDNVMSQYIPIKYNAHCMVCNVQGIDLLEFA